ncbi:MAG: hypothetical protein LBU14_01270 [Candidatus Peribacteria bacterium]|jgi:hypothetical protein|nr:hypothetical protein [Candidatus Peribacteria bacterium]
MSTFSHHNSSITAFTLIHFCPIKVPTGSISSTFEETNIFVFTQACLTILSIFITPSMISGTCSAKIATTNSGLFLDKITFGVQFASFEISATYR